MKAKLIEVSEGAGTFYSLDVADQAPLMMLGATNYEYRLGDDWEIQALAATIDSPTEHLWGYDTFLFLPNGQDLTQANSPYNRIVHAPITGVDFSPQALQDFVVGMGAGLMEAAVGQIMALPNLIGQLVTDPIGTIRQMVSSLGKMAMGVVGHDLEETFHQKMENSFKLATTWDSIDWHERGRLTTLMLKEVAQNVAGVAGAMATLATGAIVTSTDSAIKALPSKRRGSTGGGGGGGAALHPPIRTPPIACFPAGTPVLLANGDSESIEEVRKGQRVMAFDTELGENVACEVLEVYRSSNRYLTTISTDKGKVESTQHHPFWVEAVGDWIRAAELAPADRLRLLDGSFAEVQAVETRTLSQEIATYNLEIERCHCYFVGPLYVLVHNGPPLNAPGYWNYHLQDAAGNIYYHGVSGPRAMPADVERRHGNNANRFNRGAGDVLVLELGERTYGDARRMEHERIIRDGTLLQNRTGVNAGNYRGNRQSGISNSNLGRYYPGC